MDLIKHNLLLADDDIDDCIFFKEVLEELPVESFLTTVKDGVELMKFLNTANLPDVLFLDLNMPRKTGHECLSEIKKDQKLKHLPVIIFSTSFDHVVANALRAIRHDVLKVVVSGKGDTFAAHCGQQRHLVLGMAR